MVTHQPQMGSLNTPLTSERKVRTRSTPPVLPLRIGTIPDSETNATESLCFILLVMCDFVRFYLNFPNT